MKRPLATALLAAAALAGTGGLSAAWAQAPGDADAGLQVYMSTCRGCHSGSVAPTLGGVVGRKVASQPDFTNYSAALTAKKGDTWTEASLDAFLTNPQAYAPGTTMPIAIADAKQRADVIAYLKALKPDS